jgi:hypothetical protein
MEDSGYFLSGLDFDTLNADLPAGLIFYRSTIAEGNPLPVCQLANGLNIDTTLSDFHLNFLLCYII